MTIQSGNRLKPRLKHDQAMALLVELANEERNVWEALAEVASAEREMNRRRERTAHLRRAIEELAAYESEAATFEAEG